MIPFLFVVTTARATPAWSSPCTTNLTYPTSTTVKRPPTLATHLGYLGYDVNTFRFSIISLGPPTPRQPREIVERFTEAMRLGHFPIVIDRDDTAEELRQWRAGLILPRAWVTWIGVVAQALAHRQREAVDSAELAEFEAARFALYRQFEVVREVVADMVDSTGYDDPEDFVAATEVAWPTLAHFMRERALAVAARPVGVLHRELRSHVFPSDDTPPLTTSETAAIRDFHRRLLENRTSLRRIPR